MDSVEIGGLAREESLGNFFEWRWRVGGGFSSRESSLVGRHALLHGYSVIGTRRVCVRVWQLPLPRAVPACAWTACAPNPPALCMAISSNDRDRT